MKVWLPGPEGLEPHDHQPVALAPDEVRVQVEAVCLQPHDLARATDVSPGGGVVGRVSECGDAATGFEEARILVSPVAGCGECDTCRRGFATACPTRTLLGGTIHGGCAESIVAKARWLTRLDTGIEIEGASAALVAGPAGSAYGLFARAGVSAGELMVVLGQGPTAAILSVLGRSRGVHVVAVHGDNAAARVRNELGAVDASGRPQKIFVCDGEESLATAIECANPGSVVAVTQAGGTLDLGKLADRDLTLLGFSYAHPDLMTETAALVAKGELDLSPFVQYQTVSASAASQAAQAFGEGQCLVLSHDAS